MSQRRKYSPDFKREAVELTCQAGVSVRQVADELGIPAGNLARWKREMGLTAVDMLAVIAGLSRRDFYKSMTTIQDHRIWQDVYHAPLADGRVAYVKLTLVAERPVIQFKEK